MERQTNTGPQVLVEQVTREAGTSPHLWVIGWRVQNLGNQALRLLAASLPHGRFRGKEIELQPSPEVSPGKSASLELPVACMGPSGEAVENAFLILRVRWSGQLWRILARMRVTFDEKGAPKATTEVVTTQPVGFSIRGRNAT